MLDTRSRGIAAFYNENFGYVCPKCAGEVSSPLHVAKVMAGMATASDEMQPVIRYTLDEMQSERAWDEVYELREELKADDLKDEDRERLERQIEELENDRSPYCCDRCGEELDH